MSDLTEDQIAQLAKNGACYIHYHPDDRRATHEQLDQLQGSKVVTNVSADYSASYKDDIIVVDSTAGNTTITLPLAKGAKEYTIVKSVAANNLIIAFSSGQTMFGISTVTLVNQADVYSLKAITNGYIRIA